MDQEDSAVPNVGRRGVKLNSSERRRDFGMTRGIGCREREIDVSGLRDRGRSKYQPRGEVMQDAVVKTLVPDQWG